MTPPERRSVLGRREPHPVETAAAAAQQPAQPPPAPDAGKSTRTGTVQLNVAVRADLRERFLQGLLVAGLNRGRRVSQIQAVEEALEDWLAKNASNPR